MKGSSLRLVGSFLLHVAWAFVDLPLGDINVVVLTDVHSWVASHAMHEPELNANYGDVLSFYERLQELTPDHDIFFVMNGDFMDGTGLSSYPPSHLVPILEHMPWDAVNLGNHELYQDTTIEYLIQKGGFVDHWNGNYLTSNTLMTDTMKTIGSRYTYLYGKNTNSTILTFGFLYDFKNNCPTTTVQSVEETVQAHWFLNVLQGRSFDAILVLAHMDYQDPLVYVILSAIREIVGPDMPVQFITGHSHVRGHAVLDGASESFEAGRYLDTVGFVSFPSMMNTDMNRINAFQHVFVDANVDTFKATLGIDTLTTPAGADVTELIRATQEELGLLDVLGCTSQTYYLGNGLWEEQSLWSLYLDEVIEQHFFQSVPHMIFVQGTGAFRYSLLKGNITVDDVIAVSPFNDTIYLVARGISGSALLQMLGTPNQVDNSTIGMLPPYAVAGTIVSQKHYSLFSVGFELMYFAELLANVTGIHFEPVQQYHDGIPVITTGLWMEYVSQYMPCTNDRPASYFADSKRNGYFAIPACAILLFASFKIYRDRTNRHGYESTAAVLMEAQVERTYHSII